MIMVVVVVVGTEAVVNDDHLVMMLPVSADLKALLSLVVSAAAQGNGAPGGTVGSGAPQGTGHVLNVTSAAAFAAWKGAGKVLERPSAIARQGSASART